MKLRPALLYALLVSIVSPVMAADPLLLSDEEMKKLNTYFPAEDEGAPLVWKGDPLSISLPVNAEKRVIFPEPIEANLNGSLSSNQLRIINNEQSLYLTALKPFATTRMYITLKTSNKILLIDLNTANNATNTTRTVTLSSTNGNNTTSSVMASSMATDGASPGTSTNTALTVSSANTNTKELTGSTNTYVEELRFAWQQLYAPKRLLNTNSEFTRTPMRTQSWVSNLIYGDKVLVHPEVSWLSGDTYVTAVELRNKYPHTTAINLSRDLCGRWQAATLYPRSQLKPRAINRGIAPHYF